MIGIFPCAFDQLWTMSGRSDPSNWRPTVTTPPPGGTVTASRLLNPSKCSIRLSTTTGAKARQYVTGASRPGAEGTLMPIHDWTRVDAGIFHHFHQRRIVALTDVLNQRLLPRDYYALAEQQGAGFEPDVLTLKASESPEPDDDATQPPVTRPSGHGGGDEAAGGGVLVADPRVRITAETDLEFYRRKQNVVAVRHVLGRPPRGDRRDRVEGQQIGSQGFRGLRPQGCGVVEPRGPSAHPRPAADDPSRSPRDPWCALGRGRWAGVRSTQRQAIDAGRLRVGAACGLSSSRCVWETR